MLDDAQVVIKNNIQGLLKSLFLGNLHLCPVFVAHHPSDGICSHAVYGDTLFSSWTCKNN